MEADEKDGFTVHPPPTVHDVVIEINDADKFPNDELGLLNVYIGHNHSNFPVGACYVSVVDGVMYGTFTLYKDCNGLYPGICYQVITDTKYRLHTIGLSNNPNEDERIKPLNY